MNIQKQIEQKEKEIQELKAKLAEEQNKVEWIKINEYNEISTKQMYNGKNYAEILKLLKKGESIADYWLLQNLRNTGKFEFLKDFWVFVPNPDKLSDEKGYVARFDANSDRACLSCFRVPVYSNSSLGVFIVRKIQKRSK